MMFGAFCVLSYITHKDCTISVSCLWRAHLTKPIEWLYWTCGNLSSSLEGTIVVTTIIAHVETPKRTILSSLPGSDFINSVSLGLFVDQTG